MQSDMLEEAVTPDNWFTDKHFIRTINQQVSAMLQTPCLGIKPKSNQKFNNKLGAWKPENLQEAIT
jgi:hypothetical protein